MIGLMTLDHPVIPFNHKCIVKHISKILLWIVGISKGIVVVDMVRISKVVVVDMVRIDKVVVDMVVENKLANTFHLLPL